MVNLLWMLFFSFSVDPADRCEGQLYVGQTGYDGAETSVGPGVG